MSELRVLPPPPPKRQGPRPATLPKTPPPPAPRKRQVEDGIDATRQATGRSSADSHVRLRAMPLGDVTWLDANLFLDELAEEQLDLGLALDALEQTVVAAPRDPSARAALAVFEARVHDLARVRHALTILHEAAADPRVHRALLPDGPLADYLRGVYAWMHASVRALSQLARELRALTPDWAALRYRIDEAKLFHFTELCPAVHAELLALALVVPEASPPFERAVDRLFDAARDLERRLDERFG